LLDIAFFAHTETHTPERRLSVAPGLRRTRCIPRPGRSECCK